MTDHEPANFAIGNDTCKKCKYVHPLGAPCIDPGKSLDDAFREHTAMTDQTELLPCPFVEIRAIISFTNPLLPSELVL